ncbi:MAG TPA: hypothetical protein VNZ53_17200 [Steroidobacteraceae bacterium]|jgi:hypothetical protein|nr:hypothetical protein [Steroidobacteraceae bacterium]
MSPNEGSRITSGVEWRDSASEQERNESDADAELVALGREFEALSAELAVLQREEIDRPSVAAQRSERSGNALVGPSAERIEALLRLLDPIERAIMAIPAITVIGLGVKARHAAHVLSHYWTDSPDRLDWDSRAVRLLIESTCTVAGIALASSQQRESKYHGTVRPA